MRIQNFMIFTLFIIGGLSFANAACPTTTAEAFTYSDISACRACYLNAPLSGGSTNRVAADTYCLTKMSSYTTPQQICVQKMIADREEPITSTAERDAFAAQITAQGQACGTATATATITSVTTTTTTPTTNTGMTIQQQQYAAQVAAQTAAANARAAAAAAAAAASRDGTTTASGGSNTGSILSALGDSKVLSGLFGGDKDKDEGASTETADRVASGTTSTNVPSGGAAGGTGTGIVNVPGRAPINTVNPTDRSVPVNATGGAGIQNAANPNGTAGAGTTDPSARVVTPAPGSMQAAADNVGTALPSTRGAADEAARAAQLDAEKIKIPEGEISAAALAASAPLKDLGTGLPADVTSINAGVACYSPTATAITTFKTDLDAYLLAKEACTKAAERAEHLCVEGSSPGAKAAHTLIDVAGPAIAVLGAASKACSGTSKVASLASGVLLIAKTVCVGAKVACDTSCSNSAKALAKLNTDSAAITTAAQADQTACTALAGVVTIPPPPPTVQAKLEVAKDPAVVNAVLAKIRLSLQKETTPTELGTTPGLVAKCESKLKDIAGMGINILTLLTAKKSADSCVEQLAASSGTSVSGDVTTAQFCENIANSTSTFCKCQGDNNQLGCPGYVANAASVDSSTSDVAGLSLHSGQGVSGFASGANGNAAVNPGTGVGNLNGGSGAAGALNGAGGVGADSGASLGSMASAGGRNGGGGNGSVGDAQAAKAGTVAKPDDAKKWDFGSVASALFGGSKASKNGDLSGTVTKEEAAVSRRIASDRRGAEVTSASGKSNWEKIRRSYLIKESSFASGQ